MRHVRSEGNGSGSPEATVVYGHNCNSYHCVQLTARAGSDLGRGETMEVTTGAKHAEY